MIAEIDYWSLTHPSAPKAVSYGPRRSVDLWVASSNPLYRDGFVVKRVPHCLCCGSNDVRVQRADGGRCARHLDSIPCSVDGCRRTARLTGEWVCPAHWRAGVPPGSPARRVWLRFGRIVRRFGWTPEREARQERLWAWLKARCQAAARGDLDRREIDRLFGWVE